MTRPRVQSLSVLLSPRNQPSVRSVWGQRLAGCPYGLFAFTPSPWRGRWWRAEPEGEKTPSYPDSSSRAWPGPAPVGWGGGQWAMLAEMLAGLKESARAPGAMVSSGRCLFFQHSVRSPGLTFIYFFSLAIIAGLLLRDNGKLYYVFFFFPFSTSVTERDKYASWR